MVGAGVVNAGPGPGLGAEGDDIDGVDAVGVLCSEAGASATSSGAPTPSWQP